MERLPPEEASGHYGDLAPRGSAAMGRGVSSVLAVAGVVAVGAPGVVALGAAGVVALRAPGVLALAVA